MVQHNNSFLKLIKLFFFDTMIIGGKNEQDDALY